MPAKRPTKKSEDKEEAPEKEAPEKEAPSDDPVDPPPVEQDPKSADSAKDSSESKEDGQLFFSTDGSGPEKAKENTFADDDSPAAESGQSKSSSNNNNEGGNAGQGKQSQDSPKAGHRNPQRKQGNQGQSGQGNRPSKKQNWQEKKKSQKNRPRQKFRKPQRLPYEETEVKPLEIGNLFENEELKTEESIASLAEAFVASESSPILLDEFLPLSLQEMKERVSELDLGIELPSAPLREEILDLLLDACLKKVVPVRVSGILEVMDGGHGFLLAEKDNYRLKSQCPFVPSSLVKTFGLKTGQSVTGFVRAKMNESSCPVIVQIEEVMNGVPREASRVIPFTELIPYYPLERIYLETNPDVEWDNVSMRVVDLVCPVGFGQRGLIVAPPRTGKTVLQQGIARALRINNPKTHLIVLLVDERPEEVTDFRRQVPDAEVIASTFDESAESHVHAAEIVIEKARRMVEHEQDVVILLDSITRLARAYNTTMPNSGKILSGGVEATALQRPKRFFGSARNIEGGGSLTILGTALVDTGSKMDEVIFEEFKGTGNMELHLDRELSNKRIFPALDFEKSGTRKEELLYHPEELTKIYSLRRSLKGVPPVEAMEMFIQRVRKTKNNPEFLMGLGR
jgi:transcription termination factor Rho